MNSSELPSDDELADAVGKAKLPPYNFKSSQLKETDHGAETVRSLLDKRFFRLPLDTIRGLVQKLSKRGREPGKRKRPPQCSADSAISRLIRAYPPADSYSEEYFRIHESDEYRTLVGGLKRSLGFMCQLCTRFFLGHELEGHILDYQEWRVQGRILILCTKCHPVADAMRRRGRDADKKLDQSPLFTRP